MLILQVHSTPGGLVDVVRALPGRRGGSRRQSRRWTPDDCGTNRPQFPHEVGLVLHAVPENPSPHLGASPPEMNREGNESPPLELLLFRKNGE